MKVSARFSQLVSGKSWIFKQRAATSLETSPDSTTSFNSAIKVTFEFTCGFNQNGKKKMKKLEILHWGMFAEQQKFEKQRLGIDY